MAAGYLNLPMQSYARDKIQTIRLGIPPRNIHDMTGSQFVKKILCESFSKREEVIIKEILRGNFPDTLKVLRPVRISKSSPTSPSIYIWVMPDYLGVGSESDFVRTPLNFYSSLQLASSLNMELPTPKIVDHIFQQSECKFTPHPMPAGRKMSGTGYFFRHQKLIESDINPASTRNKLLSGHKKDIVMSNKLKIRTGRIAIYGWHKPDGKPIQPCSTIHRADYADYSHGLRLVYPRILVDGKWRSLRTSLKDKFLSRFLSNEGPMDIDSLRPAQGK